MAEEDAPAVGKQVSPDPRMLSQGPGDLESAPPGEGASDGGEPLHPSLDVWRLGGEAPREALDSGALQGPHWGKLRK